jgi:maltodextrin utilization protein YvdJ
MNEGINEIVGFFSHMSLDQLRGIKTDFVLISKGLLRLRIVYYRESIVVYLNAVWIRPHLEELILALLYHHLAILIMLKNSHLELILSDVLHRHVFDSNSSTFAVQYSVEK